MEVDKEGAEELAFVRGDFLPFEMCAFDNREPSLFSKVFVSRETVVEEVLNGGFDGVFFRGTGGFGDEAD